MLNNPRKNLSFTYNSLNLLDGVKTGSTVKARYLYSYDGTKVKVQDTGGTNGYDYLGSLTLVKTSGTQTPETHFGDGIIRGTQVMYFEKDHLGSIRTVLNTAGTVIERNDYYPFGMRHANASHVVTANNRYKFNGKEDQTVGALGLLDYGARMYDAQIGRWLGVDPLADSYYSISPYVYCANNPVIFIDPDGRDIVLFIWTTGGNNGVGHAGIAISNYKKENHIEVANGVETEKYRMVPDGTYTFYNNWPGGDGVNFDLKGALTSVAAHRNVSLINSVEEFTNGSTVSPSETIAPNAVLKLSTSYEQDMAVAGRLLDANKEKTEYNGAWYNCSSYVSDGLKAIFGKLVGKEKMLGPIKSITPNQLWKDTQKSADEEDILYDILKDPGADADRKFKSTMK